MAQVKRHLLALTEAVEQAYNKAVQADWDRQPSDHLWEQYRSLKARLENGEIYDPLF
jgi:hypothetical protein